jgi:hypothetical protein
MKDIIGGIKSYIVCNLIMSGILTVLSAAFMLLGLPTKFNTIYDVIDMWYTRYYVTGSVLGAATLQWHAIGIVIAGATNYIWEHEDNKGS